MSVKSIMVLYGEMAEDGCPKVDPIFSFPQQRDPEAVVSYERNEGCDGVIH